MNSGVVHGRLVKNLGSECHVLCFELNEHERLQAAVIDHSIATLGDTGSDGNSRLHGDECRRIVQLLHQMVKQLLSHLLFRRHGNPFAAPGAEELLFVLI